MNSEYELDAHMQSRYTRSLIEHVVRRLYTHLHDDDDVLYTPLANPHFISTYYPVLDNEDIENQLHEDVGAVPDILVKREGTDDILIYAFTRDDTVGSSAVRLQDGASQRGKRVLVSPPPYRQDCQRVVDTATDNENIPIYSPRKIRQFYDDEVGGARRKRYVFHKGSRYFG